MSAELQPYEVRLVELQAAARAFVAAELADQDHTNALLGLSEAALDYARAIRASWAGEEK